MVLPKAFSPPQWPLSRGALKTTKVYSLLRTPESSRLRTLDVPVNVPDLMSASFSRPGEPRRDDRCAVAGFKGTDLPRARIEAPGCANSSLRQRAPHDCTVRGVDKEQNIVKIITTGKKLRLKKEPRSQINSIAYVGKDGSERIVSFS